MKLENQVSTYEQGLRLKELGVNHGSIFYWFKNENLEGEFIDLGILYNPSEESVSAYTVAELGVMLPVMLELESGSLSAIVSHRLNPNWATGYNAIHLNKWLCYNLENEDFSTYHSTEAEARAAMLIYLLENNHTTPEEVNTRLKNS